MNLTLKDVYEMRSGIIDFTNNLFNKNDTIELKETRNDINAFFNYIDIKSNVIIQQKKDESIEAFKKRQESINKANFRKNKDAYLHNFNVALNDSRKNVAKHMIALDTYKYLNEKYDELKAANKGKVNNPVIVEFKKNIDILKSQMLKNGIYSFEINEHLKND